MHHFLELVKWIVRYIIYGRGVSWWDAHGEKHFYTVSRWERTGNRCRRARRFIVYGKWKGEDLDKRNRYHRDSTRYYFRDTTRWYRARCRIREHLRA